MKNTNKITQKYEQRHVRNIRKNQSNVKKAYEKAINKIFAGMPRIKQTDSFDIAKLPAIKKIVDEALSEWQEDFMSIMVNGVHEAWGLADTKIDEILSQYTAGKAIHPKIQAALFSRNQAALDAFINRASGPKGLNLSNRVWNYSNQFRYEIENNLALGIKEGKSAAIMARDQKRYLVEPDRLFRRIRDHEGKLVLSKAAKQYHPGQGVYRSSYKNALRLTRTETNMAYREADSDRYARSQVVLGFEVKLSERHPKFDICDHLTGKYPKTFVFKGWHPQCLCYTVPVLPTAAEYSKFEDAVLNGENYTMKGGVSSMPKVFGNYIEKNKDMLKNMINKPYWIKDNKIKL